MSDINISCPTAGNRSNSLKHSLRRCWMRSASAPGGSRAAHCRRTCQIEAATKEAAEAAFAAERQQRWLPWRTVMHRSRQQSRPSSHPQAKEAADQARRDVTLEVQRQVEARRSRSRPKPRNRPSAR